MYEFINYNKICTIYRIGNQECLYQGKITVDDRFHVRVEIISIDKKIYRHMEDNSDDIMLLRVDNDFITIKEFDILNFSQTYCDKFPDDYVISVVIRAKNVCWGDDWCANNKKDFIFDGFSCSVTEGSELIGITPYEMLDTSDSFNEEFKFDINGKCVSIDTSEGFSYEVHPNVIKKGTDLSFVMYDKIRYRFQKKTDVEDIKKKLGEVVLFFAILSGELITTTQVILFKNGKQFNYLGNCNFPKNKIDVFLEYGLDNRSLGRKALFKISDFGSNIDDALSRFNSLVSSRPLAFRAYEQLLLDEHVKILTVNNYLKVMQAIEGIERNETDEECQQKFNEQKNSVISKLDNEEEVSFVKKYCKDNGEIFLRCLERITKNSIKVLSKLSNSEYDNLHKSQLLTNIKNDRDTYTHSSIINTPTLSMDDICMLINCYKTFFRVKILTELGLDTKLIRNRLAWDRIFATVYSKVFGVEIRE